MNALLGMMRSKNRRTMHGIALVVVLWVMTLLGVMATSFAMSMRTESALAHQWTQSAKARALAEAGVQRAVMELLLPERLQQWRVDSTIYEFSLGAGRVRVAIQDESGRIDLNAAPRTLLEDLMRSVGVEEDKRDALVDAILDWRDENNLRSLHGAEDDDYVAAGLDYGAKDGLFNCVEELQQVLGMSLALYKRLEPALTVHSQQPNVATQVAPLEVLRAIPGAMPGGTGGPPSSEGLGMVDEPGFATAGHQLSRGAGLTYTVQAAAQVSNTVIAQIKVTLKLTGRPGRSFSVLSWREGGRDLFEKIGNPVGPRL